MESVTGVFQSRTAAEEGVAELLPLGIQKDRITILTPQATEKELAAVPTVEAEQPGMGKALGAAVGGAVGLAGGMGAAGAVMSALVPGIGPVLAVGLAGAALLGTIGAATGGAIEKSLSDGLPSDELFIYEDALRQGRTVLVAMADGSQQAEAARGALENAGAESIDRARHMWWLGVRDVEKEKYERTGGDFENDESDFRCGFEAALHADHRGQSCESCRDKLRDRYPNNHESDAFRRGYERGGAYLAALKNRRN
jgi:hypothetical protein